MGGLLQQTQLSLRCGQWVPSLPVHQGATIHPPCSWAHVQDKGCRSAPCHRPGTALHARKARADGYGSTRQKPVQEVSELDDALLGTQPEEAAAHQGHDEQQVRTEQKARASAAGLGPEMFACQTMEELFDIVTEEAESMSGGHATTALTRLVQLSRGRSHRVRGAPALSALAAVLDAHAAELTPKEVSMALWALAKLRANRPKLLRVLADRADALSGEMNPQDLATVMWAYGSLQHRPDAAVLQRLALAAASQFEEFQPQGISMLIWGYAKLDRVPAAELLHRCMQHFEQRLPMYQHQATANMFFSLARLRQFSPRLCQAVQAQAAARIDEFSAQELLNMLWAFVKFRYMPSKFLAALAKHLEREGTAGSLQPSDWAALVWGCASLGVPLAANLLDALNGQGARCLVEMTPAELCNVLWGLGVLGECHQPIFGVALALVLSEGDEQRRVLEPRLLRQLLQASMMAQAQGVEASLPPHVQRAAAKWLHANSNTVPSLSHMRASKALKSLGLKHQLMVSVAEGLPTVDIALEQPSGGQQVAVQVIGPHEIAANTGELLGRARAEARLLRWRGWRCVYLPAAALSGPEDVQLQRVVAVLEKEGVATGCQQAEVQGAATSPFARETGMELSQDTSANVVSLPDGPSVVRALGSDNSSMRSSLAGMTSPRTSSQPFGALMAGK